MKLDDTGWIVCLVISVVVCCAIILFLYNNQPDSGLTVDDYIARNVKRRCRKVKKGRVRVTFSIDMPWGLRLSHSYQVKPNSYTFKGFELDDAVARKELMQRAKLHWRMRQYQLTK